MKFLKLLPLLLITNLFAADKEFGGKFLVDHVANSRVWHLPFYNLHLDQFSFIIAGIDVGLSLHVIMIMLASLACLTVILISAKRSNHLPVSKLGHAIEAMVLFIRDDIVVPNLGKKHAAKWMPFVLTLFFFLLFLNLLGLVPYMATASSNINFTVAMALMTFVVFNISGIIHNGPFSYVKNLAPHGVPAPVLIILYPIEIIGLLTKSSALAIRMFANLSAGHFIIFSLLGLITVFKTLYFVPVFVGFALFIWCLELMVAFLQAYVFTLLTTLFIGSAINQDH
jgi:F-type H+-transporting ATPase subunit a